MCDNSGCSRMPSEDQLRESVREHYKKVVTSTETSSGNCCGASGSCFAPNTELKYAEKLGYSEKDLSETPNGSNLGLGCGNPTLFANLKPGESVLDLGSGAGFDAFIAARVVGQTGRVVGVDMTPEMVAKARKNSDKNGYKNVSFRLGEIEYLPVSDSTIDVIISNCVINLVPNKAQVFREAYRVLRSGGRIAISDVVTSVELPENVRKDLSLYAGCLAGATLISDLDKYLNDCGFVDIKISPKDESREFIKSWAPDMKLDEFVVSALIEAKKP